MLTLEKPTHRKNAHRKASALNCTEPRKDY